MARILLVEDLEDLCVALSKLISRSGFDVRCATTVAEAQGALGAETYDVAVIDAHLGEESGIELVRSLCNDYPKMRFIIISGYSRAHLNLPASKRVSFLAKPFVPSKLIECIQEIAGRKMPTKEGSRGSHNADEENYSDDVA